MGTEYLSTGQAARLCSVTSDTVLKWIKRGKIPAIRTAGGHYRIPRKSVLAIRAAAVDRPIRYCWEYRAGNGEPLPECEDCVVFRARALRCYELMDFLEQFPEAERPCDQVCETCEYYRVVVGKAASVLVLTPDKAARDALLASGLAASCNVEVVETVYALSATIESFRPDFVVLDAVLGQEQCREIAGQLEADPRLRLVRIIIATERGEMPTECEQGIFGCLVKPLTIERLEKGLAELRSEAW